METGNYQRFTCQYCSNMLELAGILHDHEETGQKTFLTEIHRNRLDDKRSNIFGQDEDTFGPFDGHREQTKLPSSAGNGDEACDTSGSYVSLIVEAKLLESIINASHAIFARLESVQNPVVRVTRNAELLHLEVRPRKQL